MKGIALVFLLLVVVWLVFAWTLLVWGVAAEYNGVFAATNPNGSVGGSSNINNKQNYLLEDDPTDDGNDSAHRDLAESIRILRTRRQELEEQAPQIELEELAPQIEELEKLLDGNHLNNDNRFAPSDIETREELRLARLEQKNTTEANRANPAGIPLDARRRTEGRGRGATRNRPALSIIPGNGAATAAATSTSTTGRCTQPRGRPRQTLGRKHFPPPALE